MKSFRSKNATMRHALVQKKVYLPNHGHNKTSAHYMKAIIDGRTPHFKIGMVEYISVPNY